jgi:hypothetical protein
MKIAVFSSENAGKLLVEQALTEGYNVIAYARNPSKLAIKHDYLTRNSYHGVYTRGRFSELFTILRSGLNRHTPRFLRPLSVVERG